MDAGKVIICLGVVRSELDRLTTSAFGAVDISETSQVARQTNVGAIVGSSGEDFLHHLNGFLDFALSGQTVRVVETVLLAAGKQPVVHDVRVGPVIVFRQFA